MVLTIAVTALLLYAYNEVPTVLQDLRIEGKTEVWIKALDSKDVETLLDQSAPYFVESIDATEILEFEADLFELSVEEKIGSNADVQEVELPKSLIRYVDYVDKDYFSSRQLDELAEELAHEFGISVEDITDYIRVNPRVVCAIDGVQRSFSMYLDMVEYQGEWYVQPYPLACLQ